MSDVKASSLRIGNAKSEYYILSVCSRDEHSSNEVSEYLGTYGCVQEDLLQVVKQAEWTRCRLQTRKRHIVLLLLCLQFLNASL